MAQLLIATNNPGKIEEIRELLTDVAQLRLVTPAELGLALEPVEDGADYAANAALKARAFAAASDLPALADDSGLEVQALGGAPGLHSARVAPSVAERRAWLLAQLVGHPQPWPARFVCTVCLALPDGRSFFAEGECRGEISPEERGAGGFGYDPLFIVEGLGRTMAELDRHEKNRLSHRARAIQQLRPSLISLLS